MVTKRQIEEFLSLLELRCTEFDETAKVKFNWDTGEVEITSVIYPTEFYALNGKGDWIRVFKYP